MGKGWKAGAFRLENWQVKEKRTNEGGGQGPVLEVTDDHTKCRLLESAKGLKIPALEASFQVLQESGWEGPAKGQRAMCY